MLAPDTRDLARLAADRGELRLSLFLPTRHREPLKWRNRVRGRDLVQHAGKSMEAHGFSPAHTRKIVDSALDLLGESWLWQRPQSGLALFAGPDNAHCFWLPQTLPELATFGERFVVSPLLPMLEAGSRFVALTLHKNEIGLYQGDEARLSELLSSDPALTQLRWMSSPKAGGESESADIQKHFQLVDEALGELLQGSEVPLVLLGEHRLQDHYQKVSEHRGPLLQTPGHTGELTRAQIRRLACSAARIELRREEDAALETYGARDKESRTVTGTEPLLAAAERGKVETLFISTESTRWMSRPDGPPVVSLQDSPIASQRVELAIAAVLRQSGSVVTLAHDRMPVKELMTASLR